MRRGSIAFAHGIFVFALLSMLVLAILIAGCAGKPSASCNSKTGELKNGCLYEQAIGELDTAYCGQMGPSLLNPDYSLDIAMDHCYADVAVLRNEPDTCFLVKDKIIQSDCLLECVSGSSGSGDLKVCEVMEEPAKSECIAGATMKLAVSKKDFSYCDYFTERNLDKFKECYRAVAACLKGNCNG